MSAAGCGHKKSPEVGETLGAMRHKPENLGQEKDIKVADKVKGILLREETLEAMLALSDEQRGRLILALFADSGMCEEPELDPMTRMAFICIAPGVRRAQEEASRRYAASVENGKKGGRPRKQPVQDVIEETDGITEKPTGFEETDGIEKNQNQIKPNQVNNIPPILSSLRSESMSPTGDPAPSHEKPKRASSSSISRKPPTQDEVQAYCDERGNGLNAERFCDYYAAQGWRLSNGQPMRDWKAAVRNWEQRAMENPRAAKEYVSRSRVMTDAERRQAHNDAVCRQVSMELDAMGGPF